MVVGKLVVKHLNLPLSWFHSLFSSSGTRQFLQLLRLCSPLLSYHPRSRCGTVANVAPITKVHPRVSGAPLVATTLLGAWNASRTDLLS